jgi:hypothetical protein
MNKNLEQSSAYEQHADAMQFADDLQQGEELDTEEQMRGAKIIWKLVDRIAELEKLCANADSVIGYLRSEREKQTKPLSDEEIIELYAKVDGGGIIKFARAIEAKVRGEK